MVTEAKNDADYLVPLDEYLKVGLHIGTKFRTKAIAPFIYKVRGDGLAVLNVQKINDRIAVAGKFLGHYDPKDVLIFCRRENGWHAVEMFSKLTGIKAYTGRYPPGIFTNTQLNNFVECKLIVVADPYPDKNVVDDAARVGIPVLALCDTNNEVGNIDLVLPCNNKGKKSLGLIFWILARECLKARGDIKKDLEFKTKIEDFIEE